MAAGSVNAYVMVVDSKGEMVEYTALDEPAPVLAKGAIVDTGDVTFRYKRGKWLCTESHDPFVKENDNYTILFQTRDIFDIIGDGSFNVYYEDGTLCNNQPFIKSLEVVLSMDIV